MKTDSGVKKNKFLVLLRAQFTSQSVRNRLKYGHDKKLRSKTIGTSAALGIVMLMMIGYSFGLSMIYCHIGLGYAVPSTSMAVCSLVVFVFTFAKSNGYLYAFRDFDMIMSLPFETHTVVAVKFLYMYINNLVFTLCVMIPMGVGYGISLHPSFVSYIFWLVISLFVPLIPMCISSIFGGLIAAIGSRFRFKTAVQVILSLVIVVAIFVGNSLLSSGNMSANEFYNTISDIGKLIQNKMYSIYPPSRWFDRSVNDVSIVAVLEYLVVSAVIFGLFLFLVSLRYKQINSALMATSSRANYKITRMQKTSVLKALVKKEFKRFTSSVPYIMNVGMGLILLVLASVASLFLGMDKITELFSIGRIPTKFLSCVPFGMAAVLTMSCTTGVSLSLEGKNLWILKSMPISDGTIFKGKMLFNLLLVVPAGIISVVCMAIALKLSTVMMIVYLYAILCASVFSTVFGMAIGIKFANFEWKNEIEVIKQGSASMLSILGNAFIEIGLTIGVIFLCKLIDGVLAAALAGTLLLVAAIVIYHFIMKKSIVK